MFDFDLFFEQTQKFYFQPDEQQGVAEKIENIKATQFIDICEEILFELKT